MTDISQRRKREVDSMPSRDHRSGRGAFRGLLWPDVRSSHPNYAMVLLGELVVHFGLGITSLFGKHTSAVWYYFGGNPGFIANGVTHLVIGTLMLTGIYTRFSLARLALLISVTVYILQFLLLAAGALRANLDPHTPSVSFEGTVYSIGLVLLSIAAYREPLIPGRYTHDPRDFRDHAGTADALPPDHPGPSHEPDSYPARRRRLLGWRSRRDVARIDVGT